MKDASKAATTMMTVQVSNNKTETGKRKCSGEFELPADITEDDEVLLTSVLSVLCSLDVCSGYRVEPCQQATAFMIRGTLHDENFEIGLDDMQFIHTANPLRVEHVAVSRCEGNNELLVKVINSKQRVMVTEDSVFFVCNRKRKMGKVNQ